MQSSKAHSGQLISRSIQLIFHVVYSKHPVIYERNIGNEHGGRPLVGR